MQQLLSEGTRCGFPAQYTAPALVGFASPVGVSCMLNYQWPSSVLLQRLLRAKACDGCMLQRYVVWCFAAPNPAVQASCRTAVL